MKRNKHCDVVFIIEATKSPKPLTRLNSSENTQTTEISMQNREDPLDLLFGPLWLVRQLFRSLTVALGGSSTSDVVPKEIFAHQNVLANASDVFDVMFYGTGTRLEVEKNADGLVVVRVDDIDPGAFDFALDVIYNTEESDFHLSEDNFEQVGYIAEKYDIQVLRERCDHFLCEKLAVPNALNFLAWGNKYHLPCVKSDASVMIIKFIDLVLIPENYCFFDVDVAEAIFYETSSEALPVKVIRSIIDCAISSAIEQSPDGSAADIRRTLAPLQPLIQHHDSERSLNLSSVMCELFFPDLKCERVEFKLIRCVVRSNCRHSIPGANAIRFKFHSCSAILVGITPAKNWYISRLNSSEPSVLLSRAFEKYYCQKGVEYMITEGYNRVSSGEQLRACEFNCLRGTIQDPYTFCTCGKNCALTPITFRPPDKSMSSTVIAATCPVKLIFNYYC